MFGVSFSYNMAMKSRSLIGCFLSLLLGMTLNSCVSPNEDNFVTKKDNNVLRAEDVVDNEFNYGTENSDLICDFKSFAVTDVTASFQFRIEFEDAGNTNNYYVGYLGEGDEYLPASLVFDVKDSNGNIKKRSAPINKAQKNNIYDGIGSNLAAPYIETTCDIDLAFGEEILYENGVQLINIFPYIIERDPDTNEIVNRYFDLTKPSYIECTYNRLNADYYPTSYQSKDFFTFKYLGSSHYTNYAAFSFKVENLGSGLYKDLNAQTTGAFNSNKLDIESGKTYVKATLYFGGATHFILTYKDGTTTTINSTSQTYEITNGGDVILLFENVDPNEVVNIDICDINYQLALYNTQTNSNISRGKFSQRFGKVYTGMTNLIDSNGNVVQENVMNEAYNVNSDLIIGLVFGISTLIFFGSVIPSYFYLKKKYRNDEFRRMNTKSYVTTATYGYLCIESVLLLLSFVAIRATVLANTLTVFNPTDAFIVVFGVMSIILVGYFIRYFIVMIKNNIEKKRRDRLNINQDVIDDGTLIIRK